MIQSDDHMHSEFSSDSDTPMELMVEQAIALGLTSICFTDHCDFNYPKLPETSGTDAKDPYLDFLIDDKAYECKIRELQKRYRDQIEIRFGIELGLQLGIQDEINRLLQAHSFDFIIGSSHILYGLDPYYQSFWDFQYEKFNNYVPWTGSPLADSTLTAASAKQSDRSLSKSDPSDLVDLEHLLGTAALSEIILQTVQDYFLSIQKNLKEYDQFQVYGHLDYIIRYAPYGSRFYQLDKHMELIEDILKTLIHQGKGIEINTSGLKSGIGFPNPHPKILKLYHDLGGEIITFGSDAHTPDYVGYERTQASNLLKACGFSYYTTFRNQLPVFHTLG